MTFSLALPTVELFPFQRLSLCLALDYARFALNCLVDGYRSSGKSSGKPSGGQAAALHSRNNIWESGSRERRASSRSTFTE